MRADTPGTCKVCRLRCTENVRWRWPGSFENRNFLFFLFRCRPPSTSSDEVRREERSYTSLWILKIITKPSAIVFAFSVQQAAYVECGLRQNAYHVQRIPCTTPLPYGQGWHYLTTHNICTSTFTFIFFNVRNIQNTIKLVKIHFFRLATAISIGILECRILKRLNASIRLY